MPNKTSLQLNQNRRWRRRQHFLGLALAASMSVAAGCSGNVSNGMDVDMAGSGSGDGGGDGDLALPVDPPPGAHRVTVTLSGTGTGTVTSQPAGISCTTGGAQCAADFTADSSVVLTAAGSGGSAFTGWAGACAGQGAVCTLKVTADLTTSAKFGPQSCSPDGVCWEAPLPFGYDLNSVYAISATDAWAVGNAGAAVHFDGQNWTKVPTGTTANIVDVWARASNDVYAIAGAGTVLRWNGTAWSKMATGAFTDVGTAIWGTANKVFVTTTFEFVLVYDGATWVRQSTGTRPDSPLTAITGTGNNDVWVFAADFYLCHYTTAWSCPRADINTQPNYQGSSGAIALGTADIWEVTSRGYVSRSTNPGGAFFGFTYPTEAGRVAASARGLWGPNNQSLFTNGPAATLYRYDGTKWNANPTGVQDVVSLNKVHGTSNSDVWSVGGRGAIAHYNGTAASVNRANIFTGSNITNVWASGANDAWFTTTAGTVVHYNGAAFVESAPQVTGGGATLKSIWGTSPSDVWIGGTDGQVPIIKHWNGTAWALVPQAVGFTGSAQSVDSIYAATPTTVYAAGYPASGIEKWDGTSWKVDTTLMGVTQYISKLWGSSETNVYAIEDSATTTSLRRFNGAVWAVDNRFTAMANLFSIGGSSATDVWAGGTQGVYHLTGATWSAKTTIAGSTGPIISVSSVSATDAWAVDSNGAVFHTTDGTTWKQVDTGVTMDGSAKLNTFSVNGNLTWVAGKSGILSVRK